MLVTAYLSYLAISIAITIWVGNLLQRSGRVFLIENFNGNEELSDAINRLLLVGFYLINFGFITLTLKYGQKPYQTAEVIEFLSTKIGAVIMVLGIMHLFTMRCLIKFRNFKWNTKKNPWQKQEAEA